MTMTLRALRVNAGLDQRTAAKHLDVAVGTLASWEKGDSFPTVPQITLIENLYKVKYADINFLPTNIGLTDKQEGV